MDWAARRGDLVDDLEARGRVTDETALAALRTVPRHEFVPERKRDAAYEDAPLPIGEGQTISAPHMVGIMAELLDLRESDTVLEIGTGCGYHAAVTAELVGPGNVFSVEYHASLAENARRRLDRLGYGDVSVRTGDGTDGWPEHAPYDRAYLTCAAPDFPEAVVEQVRPGGLLVGPLGKHSQTLVRARRRADGSLDREDHGGVRFVRMQ
ncbi:protein-L-isoaspartate(D-aspartate) O-methyltransferase [Halorientalis salina]|uniref:protein-L-isoaspartate(D-aspartate) O-methyltransferase n=1 Tax=Halorientalis salina TaxID=2932266 RepID=UPI0010AC798C|nr:protein-L-isoaspartate(D-aspartate) O-methyltransferase [Halorientalis salina]